MARHSRLFLIIAGGVVATLLIAVLGLFLFFPTQRVGAFAAERASLALDREVGVERVSLRLWPVPAVALGGVTVAGARFSSPESPTRPPLAQVTRVEVRPRLLPLLRRAIEIHSIVIDRPVISIRPDPADAEPEAADSSGFWDEATFNIREFRIIDGTIEYVDTASATSIRLKGVNQALQLDGDIRNGELAHLRLDGNITVDSVTADAPNSLAFPVRDLRLGVEHSALLDLTTEAATMEHIALTLQEFTIVGSGSLVAWADPAARRLSLEFESQNADLVSLIASLPEELRSWPENAADGQELTAAGGQLSVRATAEGRLGEGELPLVDGLLTLADVSLARGRDPVITELRGQIGFSLDSLSTAGLSARILGEPLTTTFSVRNFSSPTLAGSLDTTLDLGRAMALGLFPVGWTASGDLPISVTAMGPMTDARAMTVDGSVGTAGASLRGAEWPAALSMIAGELVLSNQEIVGRGLNATFGGSDLTLELAASEWLPFALGDSIAEPRVAFEARSRYVDMDELFPTDPSKPTYAELFFARLAGTLVRGRTATEIAEEAGFKLPEIPRLVLDGRFRAERVTQRGGDYRDVDVQIAGRDQQIELRDVSLRTLGGAVQLAARLGSATGEVDRSAPVEMSFQVDEVEAGAFLNRFTAFRDNLDGALLLAGAMTMRLDQHLLPEPASVSANGTIGVLGGRIANWALVERFGEQLGIASFDTIAFRDWTGSFTMLGSRIVLQESELEGSDVGVSAAGWFDVAGQLDLGATAYLTPALTSRIRGGPAATLVGAASDGDGRLPVGLRITGTRTDPTVRLDLSEAGGRVAERVREEAEAEARELARTLADRAAGRVFGSDSVATPPPLGGAAESAVQRTQDAVVGRLRGLLGSPGAGGAVAPPAADPTAETPAPDSTEAPATAE